MKGPHSAPKGIWNARTNHGKNHAVMLWGNTSQVIFPNPSPHSVKHCSYVRLNGGGGSEGCVAFQAASYASLSLLPHLSSSIVCTPNGDVARRKSDTRPTVCEGVHNQRLRVGSWCLHTSDTKRRLNVHSSCTVRGGVG